ncbi:DCN1-like protein 3 [Planococcus citri]|uniref:DCN1-like protein 3 n=1 Tax=Planococcus citri TaxID=170843 RepID=UPI0031FA191B
MGKCLSCFKPQNVSNIRVNESSSACKSKSDKSSNGVAAGDHQQQKGNSVMGGLYRCVHANRSIQNEISDEMITSSEDGIKTTSMKAKHFSPFFQTKLLNSGDSKSKRVECAAATESKINALFDKYRDGDEKDMILMEGVEKFCNDLNLQPDDFKILILAWKFNAEQMCQFTRREFVAGCKEMNVDTLSHINNKLCEIVSVLRQDQHQFKNLYRFTFKFSLDKTVGQRILPIDIAICLWKLVFTLHKPSILERWLSFLQSDEARIRGIPRDTWNMFLNFSETVTDDLSTYDDAEAWPSIFDDFVEYERDRLNQNVISSNLHSCDKKISYGNT